jgi:hypothetical protein
VERSRRERDGLDAGQALSLLVRAALGTIRLRFSHYSLAKQTQSCIEDRPSSGGPHLVDAFGHRE